MGIDGDGEEQFRWRTWFFVLLCLLLFQIVFVLGRVLDRLFSVRTCFRSCSCFSLWII